jgi:hypothetical protein
MIEFICLRDVSASATTAFVNVVGKISSQAAKRSSARLIGSKDTKVLSAMMHSS